MKEATNNKCPSCGANINFNPKTQKWDCEYCGVSYNVDDFQKLQSKEKDEKIEKENSNITEYICPDCGAVVVTDENTVATHCVYCGNTTIMKNRLKGKFKPDKLIPFKTEKNDAIKAFKANIKKKWFAPDDFNNEENIEKISGIYIPFWLYDSCMSGRINANTTIVNSWIIEDYRYTETKYYNCIRAGKLQIEDLPVDGSTKFQDEIMDSIEPYNYKEFVPFNRSYLSGFLAEKYDLKEDEVYERAKKRMQNTAINELKSSLFGKYSTVHITDTQVDIEKGQVEYALLPVWMLNIKYKEKIYTFAMNGQTSRVVGHAPIDLKKVLKKSIICFGISFAIIFILQILINILEGIM